MPLLTPTLGIFMIPVASFIVSLLIINIVLPRLRHKS